MDVSEHLHRRLKVLHNDGLGLQDGCALIQKFEYLVFLDRKRLVLILELLAILWLQEVLHEVRKE